MMAIVIAIIILVCICIIEGFVIALLIMRGRAKNQRKIQHDNQALLNVERLRKKMELKKKEYNEKINKATNINDHIDILNSLMSE